MKEKLIGLKKSWTIYTAALLLAAPELLAFLPTIKDQLPQELYSILFKSVVILFVILRVKTQIQGPK